MAALTRLMLLQCSKLQLKHLWSSEVRACCCSVNSQCLGIDSRREYIRGHNIEEHSDIGSENHLEHKDVSSKLTENAPKRKTLQKKHFSPGYKQKQERHEKPATLFHKSWLEYSNSVASSQNLADSNIDNQETSPASASVDRRAILDQRNPNERIAEEIPEDVDERRDPRLDIPLSRYGLKNRTSFYYTRKISLLGKQGKVEEAIHVYEHWMITRDRVMPTKRTFVALIGILGRVGYTKKAFELFGKMKRLGLDPEDHIYTSLFNACANAPTALDGLTRTEYLLNHMKENNISPNLITVKAAMKSLAVCGDFSRAFVLLDEVVQQQQVRIDSECFNHLLMACVGDRSAGFKRALQVLEKMVSYGIRPSTATFNLLLRSARDCSVGDLKTLASDLHLTLLNQSELVDTPILLAASLEHSDSRRDVSRHSQAAALDSSRSGGAKLEVVGVKMAIHESAHKCSSDWDSKTDLSDRHVTGLDTMKEEAHINVLTSGRPRTQASRQISKHSIDSSFEDLNKHLLEHMSQHLKEDKDPRNSEWWQDEATVTNVGLTRGQDGLNSNKSSKDLTVVESTQMNQSQAHSLFSELLTDKSTSCVLDADAGKVSLKLKDLKSASGRLSLLGGPKKFIRLMEKVRAHPDIKTFTQMLACLPDNEQSEFDLMVLMESCQVMPDMDLLNDLMMRRNLRQQQDSVQSVLKVASKLQLTPNMRTFAALALACRKEADAVDLLSDMKEASLEPNVVIMSHFLFASGFNFSYKARLLKIMDSFGLKPSKDIIVTLEKCIANVKDRIICAERNKNSDDFILSESFQRNFSNFLRFYQGWLKRTQMEKPRHPWKSFEPHPPTEEIQIKN